MAPTTRPARMLRESVALSSRTRSSVLLRSTFETGTTSVSALLIVLLRASSTFEVDASERSRRSMSPVLCCAMRRNSLVLSRVSRTVASRPFSAVLSSSVIVLS